jgi:hypothetical protein
VLIEQKKNIALMIQGTLLRCQEIHGTTNKNNGINGYSSVMRNKRQPLSSKPRCDKINQRRINVVIGTPSDEFACGSMTIDGDLMASFSM